MKRWLLATLTLVLPTTLLADEPIEEPPPLPRSVRALPPSPTGAPAQSRRNASSSAPTNPRTSRVDTAVSTPQVMQIQAPPANSTVVISVPVQPALTTPAQAPSASATPVPQPPAAPAPAPTIVVPQPANGAQPTVIVIQQPVYAAPSKAKSKPAPKQTAKTRDSCDSIGCTSFRCEFLFQWGSCRTFFGEGGKAGHKGCDHCAYP